MLCYRENPEKLFEVFLEVGKPAAENEGNSIVTQIIIEIDVHEHVMQRSGPEAIELFSCSFQLSMKFFLPINVKMPTVVGILTFMNSKNSILGLSEPEKC